MFPPGQRPAADRGPAGGLERPGRLQGGMPRRPRSSPRSWPRPPRAVTRRRRSRRSRPWARKAAAAATRPSGRRTAEAVPKRGLPAGAGGPARRARRQPERTRISSRAASCCSTSAAAPTATPPRTGPAGRRRPDREPVRRLLRAQHHARPRHRDRRLDARPVHPCHARGPRPRGLAALSGVPLHLLHPHDRRGPGRAQGLSGHAASREPGLEAA